MGLADPGTATKPSFAWGIVVDDFDLDGEMMSSLLKACKNS